MGKTCAHGLCNSNSQYADQPHMRNIRFFPFPYANPKHKEKRFRWVNACNREDFTVDSINRNKFICSKHFVGGNGPTEEHPDPIFATISQYPVSESIRSRKRLRFSSEKGTTEVFTSSTNSTVENSPYELTVEVSILSPDASSAQLHDNPLVTSPETLTSSLTSVIEAVSKVGSEPSDETSSIAEESHDMISLPRGHFSSTEVTTAIHVVQTDQHDRFTTVGCCGSSSPLSETLYNKIFSCHVPSGWSVSRKNEDLLFVKLHVNETVCMSLRVDYQLSLRLRINGDDLNSSHQLSEVVVKRVSSLEQLFGILEELNKWSVCEGNVGKEYLQVHFDNSSIKDCRLNCQTMSLHSHGCQQALLSSGSKSVCSKCSSLRRRLTAASKRRREKCGKTSYSSICNVRYLPMPEIQRLFKMKQARLNCAEKKIKRLEHKLRERIESEGETVDEEDMFDELNEDNSNVDEEEDMFDELIEDNWNESNDVNTSIPALSNDQGPKIRGPEKTG